MATTSRISIRLGRYLLVGLASVGALGADACQRDPEPEPLQEVAIWRDGTVTRADWEGWLAFRRLESETLSPEEAEAELEGLVLMRALEQRALNRGAATNSALLAAIATEERQATVAALRRWVADQVEVSAAEIEVQVAAQPELRRRPMKLRLRNIFKRFDPEAGGEDRKALRQHMEALRLELTAGANFEELARRESESQTRFKGGLIGNVEPGRLAPEIASAARALSEGQLSPVLETPDGLMILRCDEVIEEKRRPPEQVRDLVEGHLRRWKTKQAWEAMRRELLAAGEAHFDLEVARSPDAAPESVVATGGGHRLTRSGLEALAATAPARPNPSTASDEVLRGLLEAWATEVMGADRARDLRLDQDPSLVERLAWLRRQALAGSELATMVQVELEPATEAELRSYIAANPQRFLRPKSYQLDLLTIDLPAGDVRATFRLAEELRERLIAGDLDFASAAREYSDHRSASAGGELGWVTRPEAAGFGATLLGAIDDLSPGEVGPVVQLDRSLFLVRVRDVRSSEPLSFEEATPRARDRLGRERTQEIRERIEQGLRSELDIQVISLRAPVSGAAA